MGCPRGLSATTVGPAETVGAHRGTKGISSAGWLRADREDCGRRPSLEAIHLRLGQAVARVGWAAIQHGTQLNASRIRRRQWRFQRSAISELNKQLSDCG